MLQVLDGTDNTGEIIVLFVRGTGYPPALHGDGGQVRSLTPTVLQAAIYHGAFLHANVLRLHTSGRN